MSSIGRKKKKENPNYQAQRTYIFITFAFAFISSITAMGAIYWFYAGIEFDQTLGIYFILIFLGYLFGLVGILKPLPPLHHAALGSSILNLIISIILVFFAGNSQGLILGVLSFIHLYLGLRFPLELTQTNERNLRRKS